MHADLIYFAIAAVVFILVLIVLIIPRKKKQKLSWMLNLAFVLIVASMLFENRIISYPMIILGVILVFIDIIVKKRMPK